MKCWRSGNEQSEGNKRRQSLKDVNRILEAKKQTDAGFQLSRPEGAEHLEVGAGPRRSPTAPRDGLGCSSLDVEMRETPKMGKPGGKSEQQRDSHRPTLCSLQPSARYNVLSSETPGTGDGRVLEVEIKMVGHFQPPPNSS